MSKSVVKRYSKAFQLQVVREYEAGATMHELSQKYGITGSGTVRAWIEKYAREGMRHRLLVIQSPEDQEQMKVQKQRISQLEQLVAQLSLEKLILETTLAVAEEELGIDLKKNGAARSLSEPTSTAGKREKA
jgi:transposase-like protein